VSELFEVRHGDALDVLRSLPDASVDAIVSDPPAGIAFMGKDWDHHKGGRSEWVAWLATILAEARRVLKPGGHALVWALPRTSHWTATAIEDAGFEIRDVVTHLFGSGFPKSLEVSKAIDKAAGAEREQIGFLTTRDIRNGQGLPRYANIHAADRDGPTYIEHPITAPATEDAQRWEGWGTALKPASEHWILARAPLAARTVAANVVGHGTGALNIDGCRIGTGKRVPGGSGAARRRSEYRMGAVTEGTSGTDPNVGRWPANVAFSHDERCNGACVDECAVAQLDAQSGERRGGEYPARRFSEGRGVSMGAGWSGTDGDERVVLDSGGASRFFYTSKASTSERDAGLAKGENDHPTVKSLALAAWLCRLVTPPGGLVLDPFAGSGSIGCAAVREGFRYLGIERDEHYVDLARRRIEHWAKQGKQLDLFALGDLS
jgi:tRNA1(Val) A37 N6-methylase TrmN6